jgi:hypothetical protein
MGKKKCYQCGLVDSIHVADEGRSRLVFAFGPKDADGLQMYFVYCRGCQHITVLKPGWFGNAKFSQLIDPRGVWAAYEAGLMSREDLRVFAPRLQIAMVADGIFAEDWEIG